MYPNHLDFTILHVQRKGTRALSPSVLIFLGPLVVVLSVYQLTFFSFSLHLRFHQVSDIIKASLAIILLGVGIATVFDVELNFLGSLYAAIAVFCTTLGQIYTNSKQKELGLNPMQLLHRTSPTIGPSRLVFCSVLPCAFCLLPLCVVCLACF